MSDQSHLDRKYFIDTDVYNCPFCNRNNVAYSITDTRCFNWSNSKQCYVIFVECASCEKRSMHLSYSEIFYYSGRGYYFTDDIDVDSYIFYSVPTSFFVIDNRIPLVIRELISEAEGCLKMNYLTGASACTRKAIYELTVKEEAVGDHYQDKIKFLKTKHPQVDPGLFDIIAQIQDMTCDKVHEQSWPQWDSQHLILIIETLKTVLHEVYVLPKIKEERSNKIKQLQAKIKGSPPDGK